MNTIQHFFFFVNLLVTIVLLLFKKRKFDFLSIYILMLIMYSLPLIFNLNYIPASRQFAQPITDMYVVMAIPYIFASVTLITTKNNYYCVINRNELQEKVATILFFCFSLLIFYIYLPTLFASDNKGELLESSNIVEMTLYNYLPITGFLLSLKSKNKKFTIIFGLMLFFMLLFGGRRAVSTAILASAVIVMQETPIKLFTKYKLAIIAILLLVILILSKTYYGYALKYGAIEGFINWYNNFETTYLFTGSEFMTQSAILNAVLENNFSTDKLNFLSSFLAIQPIPLSYFDYSSSYFNDQFQATLFPSVKYGMASNIWADAYAAYGYIGVIFIAYLVPLILVVLWNLYYKSKTTLSIIFLVMGITLAFWIHRNSLATILAYLRNIFYPLITIYILTLFLQSLLAIKTIKRKQGPSP